MRTYKDPFGNLSKGPHWGPISFDPIGDLYILTPLGLIQRSGLGAYIFIGSPIIDPILVQHLGPVIQGSHLSPSNVGTLTRPWSYYALDPKTN